MKLSQVIIVDGILADAFIVFYVEDAVFSSITMKPCGNLELYLKIKRSMQKN
jgi:hypothetical protein